MRRILRKRFQLQLLFALIAALSVGALTIELVVDAVQHAEGFVVSDGRRALSHAVQELDREYRARVRSDAPWSDLPFAARDVTLRAISATVWARIRGWRAASG